MTKDDKAALLNSLRDIRQTHWTQLTKVLIQLEDYKCEDPKVFCRPTVSSQTSRLPIIRELIGKYTTSELLELSERLDKLEAQNDKG